MEGVDGNKNPTVKYTKQQITRSDKLVYGLNSSLPVVAVNVLS